MNRELGEGKRYAEVDEAEVDGDGHQPGTSRVSQAPSLALTR